jgi:hypothetical protein
VEPGLVVAARLGRGDGVVAGHVDLLLFSMQEETGAVRSGCQAELCFARNGRISGQGKVPLEGGVRSARPSDGPGPGDCSEKKTRGDQLSRVKPPQTHRGAQRRKRVLEMRRTDRKRRQYQAFPRLFSLAKTHIAGPSH